MTKRAAWSGLAIFLAWSAIDLVLHDWLLRSVYESAASLWRPTDEMSLPLIYGVTAVLIACFVAIYGWLITEKSLDSGPAIRHALRPRDWRCPWASAPTSTCPFR